MSTTHPPTHPLPCQVLTFYCTRRSEAYEPVLCALVGPLFSMDLDAPAVSAMLNPLVGSVTLFLGRGLTHAVRDLAWAHAHRRLHDLCTYHDPELVQHLNRCGVWFEEVGRMWPLLLLFYPGRRTVQEYVVLCILEIGLKREVISGNATSCPFALSTHLTYNQPASPS